MFFPLGFCDNDINQSVRVIMRYILRTVAQRGETTFVFSNFYASYVYFNSKEKVAVVHEYIELIG